MNIGIIDVDNNGRYPNLALMKLSAYHKREGDAVLWYSPFEHYDKVYMSKIFLFSPDYNQIITNADEVEKGGTGYDIKKRLPEYIDRLQPDYSIYPFIDKRTAYGFLTRGCIRKCPWCVVPKKEGHIQPYMDIEEICIDGRDHAILMDNNILACDYGLGQIEKIIKLGIRVDFNQALDARLVTPEIADMLARVKWIKRIRFGCDTMRQVDECVRAIDLIRARGYRGEFFLYTILMDFDETTARIKALESRYKGTYVYLFGQPYRDPRGFNEPPQWQKDLSRYLNNRFVNKSCSTIDDYEYAGRRFKDYYQLFKK